MHCMSCNFDLSHLMKIGEVRLGCDTVNGVFGDKDAMTMIDNGKAKAFNSFQTYCY